ncbi:MAG: hypothetical protein ACXWJB_16010 [Limisphaerales bacterium]
MTKQQTIFFSTGFIAGIITVAFGKVSLTVLSIGVGPLFFLAILAAIAFTDSWPHLSGGFWRYVLAACISTAAYVLALFTFWTLGGYLANLLGSRGSTDLSEFRLDMWIGLIAAALVAAVCIELMAYVLTSTWSNTVLALLVGAGILSIVVTYIATRAVGVVGNLPLVYYWAFFGILFSLGEALFGGIVGVQILRTSHPQQAVPAR